MKPSRDLGNGSRWAAEAVWLLPALAFLILTVWVLWHDGAPLPGDVEIARAAQSISQPWFRSVMVGVSYPGNWPYSWAIVGSVALLLVWNGRRSEAILLAAGVGVGSLANVALKAMVGRPRPDERWVQVLGEFRQESFPSGHVVFAVLLFGILAFISREAARRSFIPAPAAAAIGLVLLMGYSRVYLGAHWPSDVIAGFFAGSVWLALSTRAYPFLKGGGKRRTISSTR